MQRNNTGVAGKEFGNIENIENQNEVPKDDIKGETESDSSDSSEQNLSFVDFDHEKSIANFLLELTEIYGTTTE